MKTNPIPFSKILAKLMREKSFGNKQLASMAGVPESVMSDWLSGTIPRDLMAVRRLANELGTSFSYLLLGETDKIVPKEVFEEEQILEGLCRISIQKLKPKNQERP